MQKFIEVFSNNQILILGIVIFIFGIILLGYLLSMILSSKRKKKELEIEPPKVKEEIKENIEEIKVSKANTDLEVMLLKMQKSLDQKEELDRVESFELEQEQNAIISYKELVEAAKKDFNNFDKIENKEENIEEIKPTVIATIKEDNKKFKSSVFISPIYGIKNDYDKNNYIETSKSNDSLDLEKKQNDEFLEDLKNFRNNL